MTRIGIDATAIPPNRVGAGNYIFNLVRAIASIETLADSFFVPSCQTALMEYEYELVPMMSGPSS